MESQVELLEKFIRNNFKTKAEFANAIDLTRQRLNGLIREALENGGKFPQPFLKKLDLYNMNVFNTNKFYNKEPKNNAEVNEPENVLISNLQRLVESQQKTIDILVEKLEGNHESHTKKRAS